MTETGRHVRFTADFDYKPSPSTTLAYRAGMVSFVRLECAERAVKLGKAVPVDAPAPGSSIGATIARRGRKRRVSGNGE